VSTIIKSQYSKVSLLRPLEVVSYIKTTFLYILYHCLWVKLIRPAHSEDRYLSVMRAGLYRRTSL